MVSSALETSVGIAAGVAAAANLRELPYACGLGTVALLEGDVVADPMLVKDGWLEVRRPTPDPALLERWAADDLRSLNSQIEFLLTEAARRSGRWPPEDKYKVQST